jgi:diguanylate cyclase (GGDEF)-like protein/PAS domain S-box-containing protein
MARLNFRNILQRPPEAVETLPARLTNVEERLFKGFEQSNRGWFWAIDHLNQITYISQEFAELFETSDDPIIGRPLLSLFKPLDDATAARKRLSFVLSRQADFDRIIQQTTGDLEQRWWDISGRVQFDGNGNFLGYVGFAIDVTDQLHSSQSASQLALYDALTGLPNRLSLQHRLDEHAALLNMPGRSCSIVMIDLDRFKAVNDSLGHPVGDALLQQVAERLFKLVGDREKIFRLGGDEFQLVLPGCDDRDELGQLAKNIIGNLSHPYSIDGTRCVIGASIGIASGPRDGGNGEELMRNADLALYAAKAAGRGCHRYFEQDLLSLAEERRVLEDDLRDAIVKGELSLFYQPLVSMKSSSVTAVEALVRWHHPVRGSISPALFIPVAEEADLIEQIGEWVLRKACEDAAAWPANLKVAVNISPIQFANPGLPSLIVSALAGSGLAADRLELEITEGVFLSESAATDAMFAALTGIGVRLSLDDFGTGYSSLGYLKSAPFSKIKIDQSFVRGATLPGSRNGAIIAAIVALAGALDMETTAEGIESFDQLDLVRDLGVSHVQGYIYSKPIANDDLLQQLEDGAWSILPTGPARHRSDRKSVYRRACAIIGCFAHPIILRNLSASGAYIEGLVDVPPGSELIVDFGEGQLTIAAVRRFDSRGHGIEFALPLVDDGAGNLVTSHRVPPYLLATNGLAGLGIGAGSGSGENGAAQGTRTGQKRVWDPSGSVSLPQLAENLGLVRPADPQATTSQGAKTGGKGEIEAHHMVRSLFATANPLQNLSLANSGTGGQRQLTAAEWERLKKVVEDSSNPQLKHVIALVVLTGARFQELLTAKWDDVALPARRWKIPTTAEGEGRVMRLPQAAVEVFEVLPRFDDCPHVIANPRTHKPYNSIYGSWDAARKKAGLGSLSIHELRQSIRKTW